MIYEAYDVEKLLMKKIDPAHPMAMAPVPIHSAMKGFIVEHVEEEPLYVAYDSYKYESDFHGETLGMAIVHAVFKREFATPEVLLGNERKSIAIDMNMRPDSIRAIGDELRTTKQVVIIEVVKGKKIVHEITPRKSHEAMNETLAHKLEAIHSFYSVSVPSTNSFQIESRANILIEVAPDNNAFLWLVKNYDTLTEYFTQPMKTIFIQYDGQEGVGTGVTRNFFQSVIDGIKDSGLFVRLHNSDRYTINPDFAKPLELSTDALYKWAGYMMAFAVGNGLRLGFRLSHLILDALLYSRVSWRQEISLYYNLLDAGDDQLRHAIDALKNPAVADYGLFFEKAPYFAPGPRKHSPTSPTKHDEGAVTKRNIREFYFKKAAVDLIQSHLSSLVNGFSTFYKPSELIPENPLTKGLTLSHLDDLLSKSAVSGNIIRTEMSLNAAVDSALGVQEHATHLQDWFWGIITNSRNYKRLTASASNSSGSTLHSAFLEKLLFFWSGLRFVVAQQRYQVKIVPGKNRLPTANTCFFNLNIPIGIETEQALFDALNTAVNNVEQGVGLYGGRRAWSKNSNRSTKKSNSE